MKVRYQYHGPSYPYLLHRSGKVGRGGAGGVGAGQYFLAFIDNASVSVGDQILISTHKVSYREETLDATSTCTIGAQFFCFWVRLFLQ